MISMVFLSRTDIIQLQHMPGCKICDAELKRTLLLFQFQTYFARTSGADSDFKSLNFFRTSWNFLLLTSDDKSCCISFLNIIFPCCFIFLACLTSEIHTYTHTHTHVFVLLVHKKILLNIKAR